MSRQKVTLAVLLVLFVLSLGYSFWRTPRQAIAPQVTSSAPIRLKSLANQQRSVQVKLRLDLLQNSQGGFSGFKKNIFRPLVAEMRPLPVMARPATPVVVPPVGPPPPPPPPPDPYLPELTRFKFLGYLQKEGTRSVFLAKDRELFVVRKGDKVAGKYEAVSISDGILTLRPPNGIDFVIPLEENRTSGFGRR